MKKCSVPSAQCRVLVVWAIGMVFCLLVATAVLAQETPPPPQVTRVEKKEKKSRVWTNEDVEKLSGGVNVLGEKRNAEAKEEARAGGKEQEREEAKCESDTWVAAVTVVLKAQGVPWGPRYWAEKLFADACTNNVSPSAVAARLDGDIALDDGTKLRIKSIVTAGLPPAPLVVGSTEGPPLIVKWKGQALVVTKVDYIDRQYNYVSTYTISSLMLTNAATGRMLIFDMKTNSEKEIEGALQIKVSKR